MIGAPRRKPAPICLADFAPTTPMPPCGHPDPHIAGRRAQVRYMRDCRELEVAPTLRGLTEAYWHAYRRTSQWLTL